MLEISQMRRANSPFAFPKDATLLQVLDDAVKGRSELHESIIAANIKQRVDQQRCESDSEHVLRFARHLNLGVL